MKLREDVTLSVRSMLASPLESLLLILGLALSIGATAAGIAMFEKANREGNDMLQRAEYREIVVTASEAGDEMSIAVALQGAEDIALSISDLDAAQTAPDVDYAYLASRTRLRLNNAAGSRFGPPPEEEVSDNPEGTGESEASADRERLSGPFEDIEMATVEDGPEPLLEEISAYSVSADFFEAMGLTIAEGSTFTEQDIDNFSKVLVVGSEIAKTLFEDGKVMDRQIASFENIFTVIGVLEETGDSWDGMAFRPSELVSASVGAQTMHGPRGASGTSLHFAVSDAAKLDNAAKQLASWFDTTYNGSQVYIQIPREEAQRAIDRNAKISVVTLVLASAGLLIASVNVSNILYGRTLRRRKEIGILKALGASRQHIFTMFFSESLIMLAVGAVLGLGIVFGFSSLIVSITAGNALSLLAVIAGVLLSALITMAFTMLPALQATKVPAAEAIRVE